MILSIGVKIVGDNNMEVWHIWILVGVGFLIWEIFTPGFLVANVGLGCFCRGPGQLS